METLQSSTGVFHDRQYAFDSLGHFTGKTFIMETSSSSASAVVRSSASAVERSSASAVTAVQRRQQQQQSLLLQEEFTRTRREEQNFERYPAVVIRSVKHWKFEILFGPRNVHK